MKDIPDVETTTVHRVEQEETTLYVEDRIKGILFNGQNYIFYHVFVDPVLDSGNRSVVVVGRITPLWVQTISSQRNPTLKSWKAQHT